MIYFHLLLNPLQRALTLQNVAPSNRKFSRNCIYLPNINLSLYVPMLPCYHVLCYHVTMFHNAHDLILDHHAYSILLITIKPMQTSSVQLCYDFESNYLCPYFNKTTAWDIRLCRHNSTCLYKLEYPFTS